MTKTHPLTKLQLLLAILWAIPFCLLTAVEESRQSLLLFLGLIPFIGLSVISVYLGWLMAVKKEDIISPLESLGFRFTERFRGKQAAENLKLEYSKPSRKMLIGGISILSGLLCLLFAIAGIVAILRTP
jgi:hypothetical protein